MQKEDYQYFYKCIDREREYTPWTKAEEHSHFNQLNNFINSYNLKNCKCLEIGSSKGIFQDIVADYTGVDISDELSKYYHKTFICIESDKKYPFPDECFDGIWSIAVHEHIPDLDFSLEEIVRVLKPGGLLFFAPAWQCRSWAAQGYAVRKYTELSVIGKMNKATIPIRNSMLWRSLFLFPKRLFSLGLLMADYGFPKIKFKKLKPNYEKFWTSDSDACNSIDPFEAIVWFNAHGLKCLNYHSLKKAFFVRTGPLIFKKQDLITNEC